MTNLGYKMSMYCDHVRLRGIYWKLIHVGVLRVYDKLAETVLIGKSIFVYILLAVKQFVELPNIAYVLIV